MSKVLEKLEQALQAPQAAGEVNHDELRITTAAELFAATRSNDMLTRLSVLEAVALDSQGALGLGSDGDTDLIAVLCEELETAFGSELRLYVIAALTAMPADPRVTATLEQVWFLSDDTNERILAVSRLAREDHPALRNHLQMTLLGDDSDRAGAIANVWRVLPQDSLKVQVRLALAAEQWNGGVPALVENLELWLAELRGPFAGRARALLESDSRAVGILSSCWDKLSRENRAWLLELAAHLGSPELPHLTQLALGDESMQLEAIQATQVSPMQYAEQLLELAEQSPNPLVQAAAIQAGAPGDNRFRAVRASVRAVRVAAIGRLGAGDETTLVELIHDPDWRIRSAAADRLAVLGEPGRRIVQPFLQHQRLEVRMAAARVVHG